VLLAVGLTDAAQAQLEEAERLAAESGAKALEPLLTLTRARLADQRGDRERAAQAYTDANVKANLSGQKEIAVESRVELSRLYRSQGRLDNAERLLERTLREASQARLQPLEAQASAALAEVYMEGGKADAAQRSAREAIRFADRFSGRPVLARAYGTLGQASAALGQDVAALDAWTKAAETLEWIRGSLLPEHVEAFTSRPDVHALAGRAIEALEKGGRTAEAAPLKAWNRPAAAAAAGSP